MLLVELNDQIGTFDVHNARRNEIGLIGMTPFDQQHQFTRRIGRAEDFLRFETSIEAARRVARLKARPLLLSAIEQFFLQRRQPNMRGSNPTVTYISTLVRRQRAEIRARSGVECFLLLLLIERFVFGQ